MNHFDEAICLMADFYGKDTVVSLATVNGNKANVRTVDAYFKDNAFYVTTYALSQKMNDIITNTSAAICRDLFVCHGQAVNIGHPLKDGNLALRDELREIFHTFYDKHVNEKDEHTCILRIDLEDALLFANNYKYNIDFVNKSASRVDFAPDIIN